MSAYAHVLVIGAGAFGASTALELARLGHRVTVVDRSLDGYACENAASYDLNKIMRWDYTDMHYRDLGKKALQLWRANPLYAPYFHEVGIFFRSGGAAPPSTPWYAEGLDNARKPVSGAYEVGCGITDAPTRAITSSKEAVEAFPTALRPHLGEAYTAWDQQIGYVNPQAGWVEARNVTFNVLDEARRYGAHVVPNAYIVQLLTRLESGTARVFGAVTSDGQTIHADFVVMAAGSWTPSLLEKVHWPLPKPVLKPTAHCVITFKLRPDVAQLFRGSPVTFNMGSGMYTFEPNADGILKCAIHAQGFATPDPGNYTPLSFPHADENPHAAQMLREIRTMFPILQFEGPHKNADVHYTRICWYCDTADENFLIDFHPRVRGLLVASGDSGHALKFLPVLGRLIVSRLFHITNESALVPDMGLSAHQRRVFSFAHHMDAGAQTKSADSIRITRDVPSKL